MRVATLILSFLTWRAAGVGFRQPSQQVLAEAKLMNDDITTDDSWELKHVWKDVKDAIWIMQHDFFEIWLGAWPSAIDWTSAVLGTHLAATVHDFAVALSSGQNTGENYHNEINKYFSQTISYYYNEDVLSLRTEANDDMLWVVLGWLENLRLLKVDTVSHLALGGNDTWYGNQYASSFAHRARVFYFLASRGWDTSTCDGGMIWNPRLTPYKNAITNQLYISASVSMYLYFPGDANLSPYDVESKDSGDYPFPPWLPYPAHAEYYKDNAITAYNWLRSVFMENKQGLYIDGLHISKGECSLRNEMVYTYNQGVILTGLRGLWEVTGNLTYLKDGYTLIRNTINATGYSLTSNPASPPNMDNYAWSGLGRNGVLEDACDASGSCNQDAQTFKGIYFIHLARFCDILPDSPLIPGKTYGADPSLINEHARICGSFKPWVQRNARAALLTRNSQGLYGMWWTAGLLDADEATGMQSPLPEGAVDYRNHGLGDEKRWGSPRSKFRDSSRQTSKEERVSGRDLNDRGRGRTVESQSGGLAIMRALWEFLLHSRDT
jgi:hypothetical protein